MPPSPEKFYQERANLVKNLEQIPIHLFNTTHPDVEWKLFCTLKDVNKRLEDLIKQAHDTMDNTNKLIAERCTDYIVMVGTQLLEEPVDRQLVFPELLFMIRMQIGRLRLKGFDDPMADAIDRQAEGLDEKYQVRTPQAIFQNAWMYLNLYYHSTSARM
ncbi:hypothetical protein N7486_000575 [Penicillium sp. IBT 16267x]|nr:hypothetical protein N7486_000575 [Penicillium sp. IBT 16267x]